MLVNRRIATLKDSKNTYVPKDASLNDTFSYTFKVGSLVGTVIFPAISPEGNVPSRKENQTCVETAVHAFQSQLRAADTQ